MIWYFVFVILLPWSPAECFQSTAPSSQCYQFSKTTGDPCTKLNCEFGAECVIARGARNASCQCINRCYNYGDTVDSRSICGSDGVDYDSLCELRRASCAKSDYIQIKYEGKCGQLTFVLFVHYFFF